MSQQFCLRKHDTFVVGRTQRMCRECRRANDRARWNDQRRVQSRRYWHAKGYLKTLNRKVDKALQKLEAIFGGR